MTVPNIKKEMIEWRSVRAAEMVNEKMKDATIRKKMVHVDDPTYTSIVSKRLTESNLLNVKNFRNLLESEKKVRDACAG